VKAYVIVGSKYGDTASLLPLLSEISKSGEKPIVVTSKKYADLANVL